MVCISDLRLVDGECAAHGRLEVYHSGRWGTVCDDSFTDIAATVRVHWSFDGYVGFKHIASFVRVEVL